MPLLMPNELNPEDRVTYRRWMGGLFATYGALMMIFCSVIFYQAVISPRQPSSDTAEARPVDAVGALPIRQAVKHD